MIDLIIFSKNRPLQLYALLESLYQHTDSQKSANVSVIYRYDQSFRASIDELSDKFSFVSFIEQNDFYQDVINCLKTTTNRFCAFLVDDIVFKENISLANTCHLLLSNPHILTFSMRMGMHLNFCYPTNSRQSIPDGNIQKGFFAWNWKVGHGDWSYPFSLDGHIFRKEDLERWTSKITFSNPNQFEDRLQIAKTEKGNEICICQTQSAIVNLPINRVQNEYKNRCEDVSPYDLLTMWKEGKKIDTSKFLSISNTSAHYPQPLTLVDRK